MTRCVEKIESISFPRLRAIIHGHRMRFDRDPALALQVHRIEKLILLVALVNCARRFEQSVRQSGFAVIDVRDDAEIARQFDSHESRTMLGGGEAVNVWGAHAPSRAGDRASRSRTFELATDAVALQLRSTS